MSLDLPVTDALPALHATLAAGRNAILIAPPGAGKTTLVPPSLLDAPWRGDGRIIVLEPRRLAARAAANRMASLHREPVGQLFGYRTRLDAVISPSTRVEVLTEGLLLRRLLADPGLEGVAAVILDEIHERSLDADLALALCLDLQRVLRPDLRLVAMSATADAGRLASLMDADIVESAGRAHPVEIRHAPRDLSGPRDLPRAVAVAIRAALANERGDILAFLPGMAEIRRTQAELENCGALVLPLHGDLPQAEQERALNPAGQRRVVLSTSIAETSLTVPGVRIVVDGGWRRAPRLDPGTGLTRLATVRVSRAAADQRAGRAGRAGPGIAIRLWTSALHRGLPPFDRPEIVEAELSGFALACAAWGTTLADLAFLDPPLQGALAAAHALLRELGALDDAGRVTALGQRMVALGAHPRLAGMMLAAREPAEAALAADLAALLEERDPFRSPDVPADINLRLAALAEGDPAADRATLARIRRAAEQYRRRLHLSRDQRPAGDPAFLIAAGFPDRIAQRRGEPGSFRLSGGGGARLARTDKLANAPLLAVAALDLGSSARIRLAAPLAEDTLPESVRAAITDQSETSFDPATGSVLARRRRRLGALVLSDRTGPADPGAAAKYLAEAIAAQGLRPLPWTDAARQLQARIGLMRALEPDAGWPDLSDKALTDSVADWLAPRLDETTRLSELDRLDLFAILRDLVPWPLRTRLDQELPSALELPNGRAPIDYTQPVPLAAARAQTFYGMAITPRLAAGRVPLSLALLSPASRPIAVTGDLGAFWRGGWAEVRRDMRGRYPKHSWPEDPSVPAAVPVKKS
jgi:ATP-dependent helicase HrpB